MSKDGTGKHAKGENHQSGKDQKHRGKPDLTSKYEGKHTGKGGK
jgi:hypothetical protein